MIARLPRDIRGLIAGSIWLSLAASWSQGATFVGNLLVANIAGVAEYGRYALLQSIVAGLAIMSQTSFGLIAAQRLGALQEVDPNRAVQVAAFCLTVSAALSSVIGLVLVLQSTAIARAAFGDPNLAGGLMIAGLAIPFLAINYVQNGILTGFERFRESARLSLMLSPSALVLPAAGAWFLGHRGAIVGLAVVYLLRALFTHVLLLKLIKDAGVRPSVGKVTGHLSLIWQAALPATVGGAFGWLALWGGQTLLLRSEGGAGALGLFAAAFTVKTLLAFIPAQISTAVLPMLSRIHTTNTDRTPRQLVVSAAGGAFMIALVLSSFVAIFAREVMMLFGEEFASGSGVLQILLIGVPLEALTLNLYQGLFSQNIYWRTILSETVPKNLTVVAVAYVLIPLQGVTGLAIAWAVAWAVAVVGTILALVSVRRRAA